MMKDSSKVNNVLQDVLSGMYALKSFKLEKTFYKKFEGISKGIKIKNLKIDSVNTYLTPIFLIVKLVPQLIYITYGGYLAIHKEMSIGGLFAFSTLVFYVAGPVEIILNFIGSARESIPAVKRIFEIMDLKVEENNKMDLEPDLQSIPVEFENAAFSYDGKNRIFQNVSFKAPKSSYTALVGSSGIGKSTILKLICGFYNLDDGKIKIFGNDIADVSIKSVRKFITYMSQESYVYPITISENIAMGKENAFMKLKEENLEGKETLEENFNIKLKNLNFGYNDNLILKEVNLTAEKGKMTAVVGGNCCGKSTIIKLLLGFYSIGKESIYI